MPARLRTAPRQWTANASEKKRRFGGWRTTRAQATSAAELRIELAGPGAVPAEVVIELQGYLPEERARSGAPAARVVVRAPATAGEPLGRAGAGRDLVQAVRAATSGAVPRSFSAVEVVSERVDLRSPRSPSGPAADDPHAALRAALRGVLQSAIERIAAERPLLLRGYGLDAMTDRATEKGWGEIVARLERGDAAVAVHLAPRSAVKGALLSTARFAAYFSRDLPADTADKRALMRLLVEVLERVCPPDVVPLP